MSKPAILEIKERTEWKFKDVDLSYNASEIIEEIKSAEEVIVCFGISDNSFVPMVFPKQMSEKWLSAMAKSDSQTEARCSANVDFTTGKVTNGAVGYVDLAIRKVMWR